VSAKFKKFIKFDSLYVCASGKIGNLKWTKEKSNGNKIFAILEENAKKIPAPIGYHVLLRS
jgi:hypothetical protein